MCQTVFVTVVTFLIFTLFFTAVYMIFPNNPEALASTAHPEMIAVTFATNNTDGLQRYLRSVRYYGSEPIVLGLGEPWRGGAIQTEPGGGQKVLALRDFIKTVKDRNVVIVFTDGYDVVFTAPLTTVYEKFLTFNARVVFSAERACWPDESLADQYPRLTYGGYRYLNSGGFVGYAADLHKILAMSEDDNGLDTLKYDDDDQAFYTKIFLNHRDEFDVKLDVHAEIFQNLNGASVDVQLRFIYSTNEGYLENVEYRTKPAIIHGNGLSKVILNSLSNYLAGSWKNGTGCQECTENTITLPKTPPKVMIGIFIEQPTPFLEEFFDKIVALDYPKKRMHLFIHNAVEYHQGHVLQFLKNAQYGSVKEIGPGDKIDEVQARNLALDKTLRKDCDYLFVLDSIAHLDNPLALRLLIEQNRSIVAPLLVRPGKTWSNFWGALTDKGYYARAFDYMDIVSGNRLGLWNVPYVSSAYLVNATVLRTFRGKVHYDADGLDADMVFCSTIRKQDVFMYVSNRFDFGHLINADSYDVNATVPELFHIFENRVDWERRYISPQYAENFHPDKTALQPCPDVYWFPVTTMRFCRDFLKMVETFGKWSDGSNKDPRLTGGYEAVPTRDIHMNQVGYEKHWLYFLQKYVRPLQEKVFIGYFHNPPRSLMNFVVRYRPNEQPSLRPHHDSSTYTINLALNTPGLDYEGGGCRFLRYNCSVVETKPGWLLMHPGRLTHYHEGLLTTKGTRYIMISFVDP